MTEGRNAVVVVFVVKTTGNIDGIKVLSSPGEEYTASHQTYKGRPTEAGRK